MNEGLVTERRDDGPSLALSRPRAHFASARFLRFLEDYI